MRRVRLGSNPGSLIWPEHAQKPQWRAWQPATPASHKPSANFVHWLHCAMVRVPAYFCDLSLPFTDHI